VDAVEKGLDLIVVPFDASYIGLALAFDGGLRVEAQAGNHAYATEAANAREPS